MPWFCAPSKNLATEPLPVAPVVPVAPVDTVATVKKCNCKCAPVACAPVACAPVRCAPVRCAPLRCAPVACAPLRCIPLGCWKSSQPLVLRSPPPAGSEKLTSIPDEHDQTSVTQ